MHEFADRLPTPISVLLAAVIAWTLADGAWFFVGGAETDLGEAAPMTRAAVVERTGPSAQDIAALNLFGRSDGTVAVAVDAPETRLQLELHGVFLAGAEETSSAIVAERNRDGKLYFVGNRLPGNAELVRVLEDRIVLRRGGAMETLRFPQAGSASGFARSGNGSESGSGSGDAIDVPVSFDSDDMGAADEQDDRPDLRRAAPANATAERTNVEPTPTGSGDMRELVSRYRERLQQDPDGALRELGVEAVRVGDSQGFRVGNEASAADLARVGLRAGDVVLSVNGRGVQDLQQDAAAIDGIMDSGSARLEIQRDERRFFVTTRIPRM